jgi:UDP-N-acetylmuramyl pentapeptide phosphotransferase/UDP-N-acetylglucosamine-1-phosphate transferase
MALAFVSTVASSISLGWPGLGGTSPGAWATPATVLFIVWLTNAYNFMDGIDGIAGLQGVAAGIGWVCAGGHLGDALLAGTGAVVTAASLGFLVFNWPPASIFMGDVGAPFLGFLFAGLTAYVSIRSASAATAGLLFVWPFLFDTVVTLIRRMLRRENLLRAHRSHLYQRLVLTGVSHRTTTVVYGALAAIGVAVGIAVIHEAVLFSIVGILLIGFLGATLWLAVIWRERSTPFTRR